MRRVSLRLAYPLRFTGGRALARLAPGAAATLLVAALTVTAPAAAAPVDDYLAAREKAIAATAAAIKAGKSDTDVTKVENAGLADLDQRMVTLLGPVKLNGLGNSTFALEYLVDGDGQPTRQLDGLIFSGENDLTQVLLTPAPIFQAWLTARAKTEDAPPAFREGFKAAAGTDVFYGDAILADGAYFNYVALPVAAAEGETVYAGLGLLSDDLQGDAPPNSIVIAREGQGQVAVGITETKVEMTPIPACDKVWKPYADKAEALRVAAEKANRDDDPRWDEILTIEDEGAAAYRTCFAKEAPSQPFFAAATKEAEALLATARGH